MDQDLNIRLPQRLSAPREPHLNRPAVLPLDDLRKANPLRPQPRVANDGTRALLAVLDYRAVR